MHQKDNIGVGIVDVLRRHAHTVVLFTLLFDWVVIYVLVNFHVFYRDILVCDVANVCVCVK